MKTALQSLRVLFALTLLTGIIYPLALTGLASVFFPRQTQGSLVVAHGQSIGSELLAQKFQAQKYFWPRPSAADYATVPSGASNKGPTSADLVKAIDAQRKLFGANAPVDLLTSSGSGLDPHISPEAAGLQVARVAAARNLPVPKISALVDQTLEGPQLGIFGEPRLNVLRLNLALDALR